MRATFKDALRGPSWFASWWLDWPFRHNARSVRWWRWLFFEDGQGWLRWGFAGREKGGYNMTPPEPYTVAPPLRRFFMAVRYRKGWPLDMRDEDRKRHAAW